MSAVGALADCHAPAQGCGSYAWFSRREKIAKLSRLSDLEQATCSKVLHVVSSEVKFSDQPKNLENYVLCATLVCLHAASRNPAFLF